ncbi:lipopolysaccharide/colanic/teichoic acid biosynthesis glycosyltransferase [Neorhizobium galegae]|uniref:sugar transferase n=1 Tax=Neorhizobium galegae TaxID=399 RepID=UPI001FD9A99B|nr:sugar transferase [Neorhizobium galegae]MBP2547966.1 lipopolysaccharide/colanic/teichoic acid biosynthesis glycosyltransferase [Neorhizobium galegae]
MKSEVYFLFNIEWGVSVAATDMHKDDALVGFDHVPSLWSLPGDTAFEGRFESRSPANRALHLAMKRGLDISASLAALIVLAPLLLLVALIIRIESKGPVLFTQKRWGQGCKPIRVYKFRSMYTDRGDPTGIAQTVKDDPRVTRIGRIIRRTNIDELPQLLNVLKGEMSLVGPRCHAIGMLAAGMPYEELVREYHRRHLMKPGITGLAQMRGLRGPTDRPSKARARIACDLYYVENFSMWLDLKIIIGTMRSELTGGQGF